MSVFAPVASLDVVDLLCGDRTTPAALEYDASWDALLYGGEHATEEMSHVAVLRTCHAKLLDVGVKDGRKKREAKHQHRLSKMSLA